jgi:ribulose-5-phosphate 4-epimerase/fuculose-1-phosphate aldolase
MTLTAVAAQPAEHPAGRRASEAEWAVRVDLAACYRLAALFGWDDLIFTHMTARVPGTADYLINPMGLMFDEVNASNLVRIAADGRIVEDSTGLGYNVAGFVIHGAVHEARPDVACVVHLHPKAGVAVSCQAEGLLPISQAALTLDVAYHDYEGLALDLDERERLREHLGQRNHMIMRNHGLLTCGATVGAAFLALYDLQRACELQILAQSGGARLTTPSEAVRARLAQQIAPPYDLPALTERLAWPALLRRLDRVDPSYKL